MPQSSYYKNAQFGPALQRARRAYIIPNAITGVCIFGFVIAVCMSIALYSILAGLSGVLLIAVLRCVDAYTIKAVGQDEFEDVPIPDAPTPSPAAPHASVNQSGGSTAAAR